MSGLNWRNIVWSFKHVYAGYWSPLTWISHMIDCQLFGLNPGAHHMMNVLYHAVNTVLLFVLLNRLTGALWRSAFVAALFAWHPLRVESVAWACERKDVLCALFWMLALLCYARYTRAKGESSSSSISSSSNSTVFQFLASPAYWLTLFLFACGLMSKPMAVTLPCVLLLLDFWPLRRFTAIAVAKQSGDGSMLQRLIIEKIPFFALSLISCLATCHAASTLSAPLSFRLANSLSGYLRYITKTFAPVDLAVLYPLPAHAPVAGAIAGAVMLLVISLAFIFLSGGAVSAGRMALVSRDARPGHRNCASGLSIHS